MRYRIRIDDPLDNSSNGFVLMTVRGEIVEEVLFQAVEAALRIDRRYSSVVRVQEVEDHICPICSQKCS